MEKMKKKLPLWLILLLCLLGAALLTGLVFLARYLYVMFINPMSAFPEALLTPPPAAAAPVLPDAAESAAPAPTPEPTLSPEEELELSVDRDFMKNRVNILLLGWDESPERNDSTSDVYRDEENNFRSDVIMLLTVDFAANTADLISVPRDSYAPIYKGDGTLWKEDSHYKINAAFAKGGSAKGEGFDYAMASIGHLLNVPVSHYMGVDMQSLKVVVDAMGGVDYDVDVEIHLNGRTLKTGQQHLSGQQVLDYCRARKGISTDVGRNDRQQRMLFTIFSQLQSKKQLANLPKIYTSVKERIHTNLTFEQICALCKFGVTLNLSDLKRHTLAGEYINNTAYSGASYYGLSMEGLKTLVQEVFGIEITPDNRYDIAYIQADKSAGIALEYVAAADYLLQKYGFSDTDASGVYNPYRPVFADVEEIKSACLAVQDVALREEHPEYSEEELAEYLQQPLDQIAVDLATERIHAALLAFCLNRNIRRGDLEKKLLPKPFYEALREYDGVFPSPTPYTVDELDWD